MLTAAEKRAIRDKAADLIEQKGWCQHAPAQNADGEDVPWNSPDAAAYCLLGAMSVAYGGFVSSRMLGFRFATFSRWNDAPQRTAADVVAFLRSDKERPE